MGLLRALHVAASVHKLWFCGEVGVDTRTKNSGGAPAVAACWADWASG